MTISERIKMRRKELNMSVDQLAEILGKNRATIYRYENGDIENLPVSVLIPLSKALKTTPMYLIGWDTDYNDNTNNFSKYIQENNFTDEEIKKICEYADFIKSKK